MPDLDNMAKHVKGRWKGAVHAGITAPEKIGQVLASVLSNCAIKMADEGQLPTFSEQLQQLAKLPVAQREQAFRQMQFPTTPEGKDIAAKAARNVGKLICAGQVEVDEVARALSRQFLLTITETEFFGRLTEPDMVSVFKSADAAKVQLLQARQEVEDYVTRASPEFAESMFKKIEKTAMPELPKLSTEQQMDQDVDINFDLIGDDEGEDG